MKRIVELLLALTSALMIPACGDPDDTGNHDASPQAETETTSEEPEAEPDRVVVARAMYARDAAAAVIEEAGPQRTAADPDGVAALADAAARAAAEEFDPETMAIRSDELAALLSQELPMPLASGYGSACRAACAVAGSIGCGMISIACTGTTVITIGGTAIPCAWASLAACATMAGGVSLCMDRCPP